MLLVLAGEQMIIHGKVGVVVAGISMDGVSKFMGCYVGSPQPQKRTKSKDPYDKQ